MHQPGRHFLQIPGPTNTPDRVLRAMAQPTIDHRGAEFAALGREVLEGLKGVFRTSGPVVIYPASGSGAWEAALVNTLSPGDPVLAFDIGEFARNWAEVARRLGLDVEVMPGTWRRGVDPGGPRSQAARRPRAPPPRRARRAQRNVHRRHEPAARDSARDRPAPVIPALLLVDAVSSLGSIDLASRRVGARRHAGRIAERADAAAGPQLQRDQREGAGRVARGSLAALLLGVGAHAGGQRERVLSVHAGHEPAVRAARSARACWARKGSSRCSRAIGGSPSAARAAVRAWGLEIVCERAGRVQPRRHDGADARTGHDADRFRAIVLERFNMSLGAGLGRLKGRAFRIGHLGDFNELMLMGTLCGVEMGLAARRTCRSSGAASMPR